MVDNDCGSPNCPKCGTAPNPSARGCFQCGDPRGSALALCPECAEVARVKVPDSPALEDRVEALEERGDRLVSMLEMQDATIGNILDRVEALERNPVIREVVHRTAVLDAIDGFKKACEAAAAGSGSES